MNRKSHSIFLQVLLLLLLTGSGLAQDTPPVIWTIQAHGYPIESVAFTADGQAILSGAGYECRSWVAFDGSPLQTFPNQGDGVFSADISPDGQHLAVGYIVTDYAPLGMMDLWDAPSETVLDTHGGCYVAFSPSGEIVASGGGGVNRSVALNEIPGGVQIASYDNGPGYITDLAFSPDELLLAVSNSHNEVRLWDTQTHTVVRTLTGHTDDVRCIAFSPDGAVLAAGAGGWDEPSDSTIKLWRVSDGELLMTLPGHGDWTHTLAFDRHGQLLASSGRDSQTPYSASLRFWRLSDGELVHNYDGLAKAIAFSPDGQTYCYGKIDGTLVMAGEATSATPDTEPQLAGLLSPRLLPNYPNPFNPTTSIAFELAEPDRVELAVYALDGKRVATLHRDLLEAGEHRIFWHGTDDSGRALPSGAYFMRLNTTGGSLTRPMMLVR